MCVYSGARCRLSSASLLLLYWYKSTITDAEGAFFLL